MSLAVKSGEDQFAVIRYFFRGSASDHVHVGCVWLIRLARLSAVGVWVS
jgi:hypothetical protein